ncbi:hypothetical protein M2128_001570 [Polynucleobacter sphagniphilus]|uniref:hypothetical protein n=1 Tax=Polynucleobacter sphagniphilus TaxID=1743169 RepID=UPI0024772B1F|nr:hypothetical protein [Polynucleobacter sphagniphilus]MDH6302632.1 hypothetical protein [Polynucleobacter sphagniphilus]
MGAQLISVNKKAVVSVESVNRSATDEYIRRYQVSTRNAIENLLNMGEAVNEIYKKSKSGELNNADLQYFCDSVGLDPKSPTFRKYKGIGINAAKFRQCMSKLPATLNTLYDMATLDPDDFERYVVKGNYSSNLTHEQFKKMVGKSVVRTKNKLHNPPQLGVSRLGMAKVIKRINQFSISIVRDLPESDFNRITTALADFRNKGWIVFDDPELTENIEDEAALENQLDDDEKYFITLAEQDARELRM